MLHRLRSLPLVYLVAMAAILLACGSDDPAGSGGTGGGAGATGGSGGSSTGGSSTGGSSTGGSSTGGSGTGGSGTGGSGTGGAGAFECSSDPNWPTASVTGEGEMVAAINAWRDNGATCGTIVYAPTTELTLDMTLRDVARCWAKSMGDEGWFAHERPDGLTIDDAVTALYGKPPLAAPIALGQASAAQVVSDFMQSDETCKLVMQSGATTIGVGHYSVGDHWMMLMAD